jgi:hypothetical protein
MTQHKYSFKLLQEADSLQMGASFMNEMREIEGVLEISRHKADESTMDLGQIVEIVATSGATLAIAQGLSDWIRRHRGVKLVIEKDGSSGSIKTTIENTDSKTALAITEVVVQRNVEAS